MNNEITFTFNLLKLEKGLTRKQSHKWQATRLASKAETNGPSVADHTLMTLPAVLVCVVALLHLLCSWGEWKSRKRRWKMTKNKLFTFQMLVRLPQSPSKAWHDESQPAFTESETQQKRISQNGLYLKRENKKTRVNKASWARILYETGLWRKDTGTGNQQGQRRYKYINTRTQRHRKLYLSYLFQELFNLINLSNPIVISKTLIPCHSYYYILSISVSDD